VQKTYARIKPEYLVAGVEFVAADEVAVDYS